MTEFKTTIAKNGAKFHFEHVKGKWVRVSAKRFAEHHKGTVTLSAKKPKKQSVKKPKSTKSAKGGFNHLASDYRIFEGNHSWYKLGSSSAKFGLLPVDEKFHEGGPNLLSGGGQLFAKQKGKHMFMHYLDVIERWAPNARIAALAKKHAVTFTGNSYRDEHAEKKFIAAAEALIKEL
jgi:hypothetical protein